MLLGVTDDGSMQLIDLGSHQGTLQPPNPASWPLHAAGLKLACHGKQPLVAVLCSRQVGSIVQPFDLM